jgi:hypothetical protein
MSERVLLVPQAFIHVNPQTTDRPQFIRAGSLYLKLCHNAVVEADEMVFLEKEEL